MKNIISAQFRQIFNDKLKFIVFILCILMSVFSAFSMNSIEIEGELIELSASQYIMYNWEFSLIMSMLFISISVGEICAGDFADKTIYTELLGGCTRTKSYFGRAVTAIIFTMAGTVIIAIAPVIFSIIFYGWGTLITFKVFLLRFLLMLAPFLRLICMTICLAFIIKNRYILIALSYCMIMLTSFMKQSFTDAPVSILGVISISKICSFDTWATYGINNDANYIIDSSMQSGDVVSIVAGSVVASVVFLIIGCTYFHYDDLN